MVNWTQTQASAFDTAFRGSSDHLALSIQLAAEEVQSCKRQVLVQAMLLDVAA